jgi:hypothetical protein
MDAHVQAGLALLVVLTELDVRVAHACLTPTD